MDSTALPLRTLLYVRELESGDVAVCPCADPALVSYGDEAIAISDQALFLADYLATASPDVVARFAFPEGVTLRTASVLLPRDELPRRVRVRSKIAVPCLVIPAPQNGSWVRAMPVEQFVYVRDDEDFDAVVTSEIERLARANEITADAYLRLLPASFHKLVPIDVPMTRLEKQPPGRAASMRKALLDREKKKWAHAVLDSVGSRVTSASRGPLVARDTELAQLRSLLGGDERRAVLLTGDTLVGKSALVHAWLAGAANTLVYATSGAQLVAGMSGLGQWQERVRRVMEAAHILDAVLYFDDLADVLGDRPDAHVDIPRAMKPFLDEGRVRLVGELRAERLATAERHHQGFLSMFTRVRVTALSAKLTAEALSLRVARAATHTPDAPRLDPSAIQPLVELAERYLPYQAFPGKAMRLYDDVRGSVADDYTQKSDVRLISAREVYEVFSTRTGIPAFLLRDDFALRREDVVEKLGQRVVGQREAVAAVADVVCVVKARLQPAGKPLATFLFVGPTGVGKTELARALAQLLFGSGDRMIRFDMSEYTDPMAAERLIRGTDSAEGLLTRKVREQPFSIVLLDEIEKADSAVFDLLLQLAGEGRLTDARGKTAYFDNAIVILTSNLGARAKDPMAGFGHGKEEERAVLAARYERAVHETFRPEMINRIDRIVPFSSLSKDEIRDVARMTVERIGARRGILDLAVKLEVSDAATAALAERGFSPAYGARALRRCVEDELVTPIARLLSRLGDKARGARVVVDVPSGATEDRREDRRDVLASADTSIFRVVAHAGRARAAAAAVADLYAIVEARREIDRHMRIERITQIKDQLSHLVAQLGYGKKKRRDPGGEVARMQSEHHQLKEVWTRIATAQSDMHTLEEMAIGAGLAGEPVGEVLHEATEVSQRFRRELVGALLAMEPGRDHATVIIDDLGEGPGLAAYLVPLLEDAVRRKWTLSVHFTGDARGAGADWPGVRKWGAARDIAQALDVIAKDKPRAALVRGQGPLAGALLTLEAGLHILRKREAREGGEAGEANAQRPFVQVRPVAMRTSLTDADWTHTALNPILPTQYEALRKASPARDHDASSVGILAREKWLTIPFAQYFVRLEEIALEILLRYENDTSLDRDDLFTGPLDGRI